MDKERAIIDLKNFKIGHIIKAIKPKDHDRIVYIPSFYYILDSGGDSCICFNLTEKSFLEKYAIRIGSDIYNLEDISLYERGIEYGDLIKPLNFKISVAKRNLHEWWYTKLKSTYGVISFRINTDGYTDPVFDNDTSRIVGFKINKNYISGINW